MATGNENRHQRITELIEWFREALEATESPFYREKFEEAVRLLEEGDGEPPATQPPPTWLALTADMARKRLRD